MSSLQRATGVLASRNGITVFFETGESEILLQDDYNTGDIARRIAADIARQLYSDVDISEFKLEKKLEAAGVKVEGVGAATAIVVKTTEGEEKKIVVGEALKQHMEEAVYGSGMPGFKAFMTKFSEQKCPYTAKDLLDYMRRTDLPIADDGRIIVYKILKKGEGALQGKFVDPHTRKVPQQLGSIVEIDRKILDPSKRNLCSTGLHVCYNKYAAGFSGEVLMLCKVEPSDCIAVAHGDHKMRVAAYEICAILPDTSYVRIRSDNGSAVDKEGRETLMKVIAGDHQAAIEHVIVRGENGTKIEIVPIAVAAAPAPEVKTPELAKAPRQLAVDRKKGSADTKDLKAIASFAGSKKEPKADKDSPYPQKLARAMWLVLKKEVSIREVCKILKMDRETLGKRIAEAREAISD